jgi:DNA-binding transcriptional LysR family regulator
MNITLRQLHIFMAVAAGGNVTRAANELNLTQSAVSTAIRELEQQLGLSLFDRAGKRIRLNRQGDWLLPRARRILDQVQGLADELGQAGRQSFSVGASTTIADCLFPRLAVHLYAAYPGLELHLHSANSSDVLASLLAHSIEIGLVEGICQHPKIEATAWWTDRLAIIARPDHPLVRLAAGQPLPAEALAGSRWIMREPGSGTRDIFEHAFADLLTAFDIAAELPHLPTIKALVADGDTLACISEISVADELAAGRLARIGIAGHKLERQFYMLRHRQAYHGEIQRALADWLSKLSREKGSACNPVPSK